MKIGAPKETAADEARVAMTPQSAKDLQKLGYECLIEKGAGLAAGVTAAVDTLVMFDRDRHDDG